MNAKRGSIMWHKVVRGPLRHISMLGQRNASTIIGENRLTGYIGMPGVAGLSRMGVEPGLDPWDEC